MSPDLFQRNHLLRYPIIALALILGIYWSLASAQDKPYTRKEFMNVR
jgi:hypothetical protein